MPDEIPTKQELEWAGKVWGAMMFRECYAIAYMAFGYAGVADAVAAVSWADIGAANQLEITRNLLSLNQIFARGRP
jgi:hypothetical protein